jgi:diaminopimelate epimerase
MLLDEEAGRLTPLVWVPGARTLFWERSCASGSAAVGAYLARKRGGRVSAELTQPGGTLYVEASPVGEILLRGTVRVTKVGKIFVK